MPAPYVEGQPNNDTPRQRSLGPPDAKAIERSRTGKQRSRSPTKDVEYREVTGSDQYVTASASSEYMPARRRPTTPRGRNISEILARSDLTHRAFPEVNLHNTEGNVVSSSSLVSTSQVLSPPQVLRQAQGLPTERGPEMQ